MMLLPNKNNLQRNYHAVVNTKNPITNGLMGIFSNGAHQVTFDSKAQVFPSSDTGSIRIGEKGILRDFAAGTKAVFNNRKDYGLASPMTIVCIADVDTLSNYGALISCQNTTTTNGWELRLGYGSAGSDIVLHRSTAGGYRQHKASASNLITSGTKNNFIAVTSDSANTETIPNFNINGINYTGILAAGLSTGAQTEPTSSLYIGSRYDGVTKLDGAILMTAIWNRALSFSELESIRINPNQLLTSGRSRNFVGYLAAGGSSIKTINGLAYASVKTRNGLAIASMKTLNGLS